MQKLDEIMPWHALGLKVVPAGDTGLGRVAETEVKRPLAGWIKEMTNRTRGPVEEGRSDVMLSLVCSDTAT